MRTRRLSLDITFYLILLALTVFYLLPIYTSKEKVLEKH